MIEKLWNMRNTDLAAVGIEIGLQQLLKLYET
jgi:hypothetical protein